MKKRKKSYTVTSTTGKVKFKVLLEARTFARNLLQQGSFISLQNSNGVILPIK